MDRDARQGRLAEAARNWSSLLSVSSAKRARDLLRMTLNRQLVAAISALFLAALIGIEVIHLKRAQEHLQKQLESLAQDAATSLGLSLGALLRGGDIALAETIINPVFDRGHYERIELISISGETLVSKSLSRNPGQAATRRGSPSSYLLSARVRNRS